MKSKELQIAYISCQRNELNEADAELVIAAERATYSSYAPYSNFHVGAAVRLENNEIYCGSNQENAAFGAGTCAERTAMFYVNANSGLAITTIAVVARGTNGEVAPNPITPCGLCRQALLEAQTRSGKPIRLLLAGKNEILIINSVSDLLPFQFDAIV